MLFRSLGNIYGQPVYDMPTLYGTGSDEDEEERPKFINELLDYKKPKNERWVSFVQSSFDINI